MNRQIGAQPSVGSAKVTSSVRPLAVDEQVGIYKRFSEPAGIGGMGIVYKALDLKLNRTVARIPLTTIST